MSTSEASFGSHVGGWGQQATQGLHAMMARSCAVLEATRQGDSVQSSVSVDLGKASRSWEAEEKGCIGYQGPEEKVTEEKKEGREENPSQFLLSP